jgi:PAS domain S-box-containing protein
MIFFSFTYLQKYFLKLFSPNHSGNQSFQSVITQQFSLVCIAIFFLGVVLDILTKHYWLTVISLVTIFVFALAFNSYYREKNFPGSILAILAVNTIIFLHDATYGIKGGVYFFYFPLFLSVISTVNFRRVGLFLFYVVTTGSCWLISEVSQHSLFLDKNISDNSLYFIFLFCQVTSMLSTITFGYLILVQIRQSAIIREREKLKSVLDNNSQMIMLLDKDHHVEFFNSGFADYYQSTYGKILETGASYWNFVNPENEAFEREGIETAFNGKVFNRDELVTAGNQLKWMNLSFFPIISKDGEVKHVAFSVLDVSERKEQERQLSEQNLTLVKLNKELDNFIYRSSHDMRAPLLSVLGLIKLSRMETDLNEKADFLNMMEDSILKLDRLLSGITSYAKNKKLSLNPEKIDFQSLIHELVNSLKYAENARNVDISLQIHQSCDFFADQERIRSVIGNLISNAIRYQSPERKPSVAITADITPAKAMISIHDNGIGIAAEHQSKVFDMFFRASVKSVGSGLGLYIVKETLNTMHGTIRIESEENVGTNFEVEIPNQVNTHLLQKQTKSL